MSINKKNLKHDLELITQKLLAGEAIDDTDEETLKVLSALIRKSPQHQLSREAKQHLDKIIAEKIRQMQAGKKKTAPNSRLPLIAWMLSHKRLLTGLASGMAIAVIGVFSFFLMVAAPLVIGSNVDAVTKSIAYNAPIKITFNAAMNREKTQRSFHTEPRLNGNFAWDGNTMIFTPAEKFQIGTRYTIKIDENAETVFGKHLEKPYTLNVLIKGPPEVTFSAPQDIVVGQDARIVMMFNQPMISLKNIDQNSADNIHLEIMPRTEGTIRWIDTASFEFVPKNGLMLSTNYTIQIKQGSQSADGGSTEQDYMFGFSTISPKVVSLSPASGYNLAGPSTKLAITFNQPVDLASLKENFQSKPDIAPQFQYDAKDRNTVQITTGRPLELAKTYEMIIGKNLRGAEGNFSLGEDTKWSIVTVGAPKLVLSDPANQSTNASETGITLTFSNPIDYKSFDGKYTITPQAKIELSEPYFYGDENNENTVLNFAAELMYDTQYTLTLQPGGKDIFGQTIEQPITVKFKTKDRDPFFDIAKKDVYNLFSAYQKPVYPIKTINIARLDAFFCRMDQATFLKRTQSDESVNPTECIERKNWSVDTAGDKNKTVTKFVDFESILGKRLEPGIYYFSLSSDKPFNDWEKRKYVTFFVSKTALTMKADDDKVLVWATDLATGQPVADMTIEIHETPTYSPDETAIKQILRSGKTDKNGLFEGKLQSKGSLFIIGKKGDDIALLSRWWNQGIAAYDFGFTPDYNEGAYFSYLYTERPIYRPEQKVYFKGIVRVDNDAKFELPDIKEAKVEIVDAVGTKVYEQKMPLSKTGTFNGEFTLDKSAATGQYQINMVLGERYFSTEFFVEEYRKPEFSVSIATDKDQYSDGDTLTATLKGAYYFGGALKNKNVTWTLSGSDAYIPEYEGEWYSFADNDGFWYCFDGCNASQSQITSQTGTLNEQGELKISIPLSLKDKKINQLYTLEATIEDDSHQTVSNRNSFVVNQGSYNLGIRADGYAFSKGEKGTFKTILLDLERKPVANRKFTASLFERTWKQVEKKNIDGEFYKEFEPQDTLIKTQEITSDADGSSSFKFDFATGGEMVVRVQIQDDKGRKNIASTSVYVSDDNFISWFSGNDSRINLIPDKQEYAVGERAKVLIRAPFENSKALITYERRGILHSEIMDIPGTSQLLEIPITENFAPNMYVSAVLVKGGGESRAMLSTELEIKNKQLNTPDLAPETTTSLSQEIANVKQRLKEAKDTAGKPEFRVGYALLRVPPVSHEMKVVLTPDKDRYKPGETVTLTVKTTNNDAKPVAAEVSVAVVDQAVLALKTREQDILNAFYGKKDLGVDTSSSLAIFTDTVDVKSRSKGGGGGELPPNIRGNFKDTAYFQASVTTDARSGEGKITFTLPDNLTTWKATGVAVNDQTMVGVGNVEFLSSKDLLIRPVLPRFVRLQDEVNVEAIVHNGQKNADTVLTRLDIVEGDVELVGAATQSKDIASDGDEKMTWKLRVKNGTHLVLQFTASGKGQEDGVRVTLPILGYATPEVVATSGEVTDPRSEVIEFGNQVVPSLGQVSVTVYASLLTNLHQGLEALIRYPYGCAEQTMSALLGTISVKNIFANLQKPLPRLPIEKGTIFENEKLIAETDPQKQVDGMLQIGLQKIYSFQRADGGFGYWQDSRDSNAHLSAYLLLGFSEIEKSGYQIDPSARDRGLDFLRNYVRNYSILATTLKDGQYVETDQVDRFKANERAILLYVLSRYQQGDLGLSNNLYEKRDSLNLYAKGYLLDTLRELKQTDKVTTLKNELLANLVEDVAARTAHFEEKNPDSYGMNTDTRTTAIILRGLLATDPDNPTVPKIVRYLARQKNYFRDINTQEISYTLFALNDYLKLRQENSNTSVGAKVSRNGETVMNEILNETNPQKTVTLPVSEFVDHSNEIVFENSGSKGSYFYDIVARYFIPLAEIEPRSNGFSIKREYFTFSDDKMTKPVQSARVGDTLRGKLTIVVPKARNNVVIEAHLPAGLEAVNFHLDTAQQSTNPQDRQLYGDRYWESGLWHFNHIEIRDDRIALFADQLPAGVYEYTYVVQGTSSGIFANPPTLGYEMYFPEIFGRSRGELFTVTE